MSSLPQKKFLWCFALAVISAFGLGFYIAEIKNEGLTHETLAIREHDERYEFIRPLLICQIDEQIENQEYKPLEKQIEGSISEARRAGEVVAASVYFRDLDTGRWIGVNEEKPYAPASLLKVPIMMTYLKEAEENPELLNKKYGYERKPDDINPLITERFLQSGQDYTVSDLIRGMIVQSDNSAKDVLTSHISPDILNETYTALEIRGAYDTTTPHDRYEISTKKYALFFRVLYNGTFLSREMSNRAAEFLTEVQFDKGLRAGTPTNVRIAHKYGVSATPKGDGSFTVELSDCGIVYSQSSPYLLCVMTEGSDPFVLAGVIKKIAEIVYKSAVVDH